MRSQEDTITRLVRELVLGRLVTSVLVKAAEQQLGDDLPTFGTALEALKVHNISFWLSSRSELLFWLDRQRSAEAKSLMDQIEECA